MNKEKALKNQGLEFREDIIMRGGVQNIGDWLSLIIVEKVAAGHLSRIFETRILI